MPNPTISDVHVNVPLTNISIAYIQQASNFIADKVFPNVPVQKQSDRYYKYLKEDWFRVEAKERAPGTESAGGGWRIDNTPTYYCRPYAVHNDLDDMIRANADAPLNMDRDATEWVTQQLLIKRETLWAASYFGTGIWTDRQGGASPQTYPKFVKWSDFTNSDPITDIDVSITKMASTTGYKPNTLVISPDVFVQLKNHPKILDRIKYTQQGVITEGILAGLFGVEKLLVPWGVVNSAAEGAAESTNFIFSGKALLIYAAPAPSILKPSGGYTFSWTGYLGAGAQGNRMKRFRMEQIASDRIEGEMAFDLKLIASDLGVLFYDVI
jgi:hypothetical protein